MSWQGIVGHDANMDQFRRSLEQDRLATTFLFVGPEGIGKRTFALKLAQSMLCSNVDESKLDPCNTCADCQQVVTDSHPDLQLIAKPEDKAFIPVDVFIGDREHRRRTGLCHFISLTPTGGKRRIAIVDDADWLNQEGANSLLKTLEEPSPGAVIILISTSVQRQLPTIRSRSQVIRFQPLSNADVADCLLRNGQCETEEEAASMAANSAGSLSRAIQFSGESITEIRRALWSELSKPMLNRNGVAKLVNEFVESGGKEAALKRKQLRLVFDSAVDFYRCLSRELADLESDEHDVELRSSVAKARNSISSEVAVAQIERCLDAIKQVNANANLGMLVDAWVCDLAVVTRTNQPMLNSLT